MLSTWFCYTVSRGIENTGFERIEIKKDNEIIYLKLKYRELTDLIVIKKHSSHLRLNVFLLYINIRND